MASLLALVVEQLAGDLVVGGRQTQLTGAFIAGLGVVGLDHRLDQDHVGFGDGLLDMLDFLEVHAVLLQFLLELVGQAHLRRRDERDRAVELGQGIAQRVHRAHAHVADGQPLQAVDAALFAQDGVQVGQDLGRVLAPAVAAVDDRHARPLGGFVRRALLEVAHHDHIAVEFQHLDRVLDRLLVEVAGAGHLGIREAGDVPAQAVHGGFVRQARAGATADRTPSPGSSP